MMNTQDSGGNARTEGSEVTFYKYEITDTGDSRDISNRQFNLGWFTNIDVYIAQLPSKTISEEIEHVLDGLDKELEVSLISILDGKLTFKRDAAHGGYLTIRKADSVTLLKNELSKPHVWRRVPFYFEKYPQFPEPTYQRQNRLLQFSASDPENHAFIIGDICELYCLNLEKDGWFHYTGSADNILQTGITVSGGCSGDVTASEEKIANILQTAGYRTKVAGR